MPRDNFKKAVVDDLARRVAFQCSNPGCEARTIGPKTGPEGYVNTGIAAHITAASPGGPRYDVSLTAAQRSAISNGIWLCNNCASHIDRDVDGFPVALLEQWKQTAEARALLSINKSSPTKDFGDLRRPIFGSQALAQAGASLTAIAKSLEALDPRFKVSIAMTGSQSSVVFEAREAPVDITMTVANEKENQHGLRQLLEYGLPARFDGSHVQFSGTPLLEGMSDQAESILVTSNIPRDATLRLSVSDSPGKPLTFLDQASIRLSAGYKGLAGIAEIFGGFMAFESRTDGKRFSFSATPDYNRWTGKEIRQIPFFDKVYRLGLAGRKGGDLEIAIEIEIDGNMVAGGQTRFPKKPSYYGPLDLINHLRIILSGSPVEVRLPEKLDVSAEEVDRIVRLVRFRHFREGENIVATIVPQDEVDAERIRAMVASARPSALRLTEPFEISGFGPVLKGRTIAVDFSDVVATSRRKRINVGDAVSLKFVGTSTSRVSYLVS